MWRAALVPLATATVVRRMCPHFPLFCVTGS